MKLTFPYYYKDFSCIASACPDNCCVGWEICIDGETMKKYRHIGGGLGDRLKKDIVDGSFVLKNNRCPFLNEGNLCDIITELSEDALCDICKRHPRFVEQFGDTTEIGFGLSCPECARLILTSPLGTQYLMSTDNATEAEVFGFEENDDDPLEIEALSSLRERIFEIIISTESAESAAEELLDICLFAQNIADNDGIIAVKSKLSEYKFAPIEKCESDIEMSDYMEFLSSLEPVDDNWRRLITSAKKTCVQKAADTLLRKVLLYYVYRYLMLSLFDGDIYSKARLCVFSLISIRLLIAVGLEKLPPYRLAALYSKQMEYSEECLDAFYDECEESELFSYDALVKLLRNK